MSFISSHTRTSPDEMVLSSTKGRLSLGFPKKTFLPIAQKEIITHLRRKGGLKGMRRSGKVEQSPC